MTAVAAPTARSERITNLDTVRGFATLGILVMNAVSFGLPSGAYFNLDAAGSDNWLDWAVGIAGEIVIDQKTMAMFSLLFGVGIVVFADRAAAKGRRPVALSLWRNLLLFGIGLVHYQFWDGDVLMLYALCSPVLLALRKRSPRLLIAIGSALVLNAALTMTLVQLSIDDPATELGDYWFVVDLPMSGEVEAAFLVDFGGRALGMMLIGVGLYRLEIVQGLKPAAFYRRMARLGLAVGLPLAVLGVVIHSVGDWSGDVALVGAVPNTLATIPLTLAYLALITLWNQRPDTSAHERIRAVGRMALTNYLTQTAIGLLVLDGLFEFGTLGRAAIFGFVLSVWALQIAWSKPWLDRFRFGPVEWAWRTATYRRLQPIRREPATDAFRGSSTPGPGPGR